MNKTPKQSFATISQLISSNIELVKRFPTELIFLFLIPSLLISLGDVLGGAPVEKADLSILGATILAIGLVWLLVSQAPAILFTIKATAGKNITTMESYRQGLRFTLRLLGMYLLMGTALILGFIALFIPGLVVLYFIIKRYYLAPYYLIDEDLSIKEALTRSQEQTAPYTQYIAAIFGIEVLFGVIGALAAVPNEVFGVFVGLLTTLMVVFLSALRYQEIKQLEFKSIPAPKE